MAVSGCRGPTRRSKALATQLHLDRQPGHGRSVLTQGSSTTDGQLGATLQGAAVCPRPLTRSTQDVERGTQKESSELVHVVLEMLYRGRCVLSRFFLVIVLFLF